MRIHGVLTARDLLPGLRHVARDAVLCQTSTTQEAPKRRLTLQEPWDCACPVFSTWKAVVACCFRLLWPSSPFSWHFAILRVLNQKKALHLLLLNEGKSVANTRTVYRAVNPGRNLTPKGCTFAVNKILGTLESA